MGPSSGVMQALADGDSVAATREFYAALRHEVRLGESDLAADELALLRAYYPIMMRPDRYPPPLVTTIYVERRAPAVAAILDRPRTQVFDAGCGFGSECFLFAATGAEVLAVDQDPRRIAIARRRQAYYEDLFGRRLAITFVTADLDAYALQGLSLSLTWMASTLSSLVDQEAFLQRLHAATLPGGRVMVTDMNLLNPLFAFQEWRSRRRAKGHNAGLARRASFWRMFFRRRRGARYFPDNGEELVGDDQLFWWRTLARLLHRAGFEPGKATYSGFAPPFLGGRHSSTLETALARLPLLRRGGYFYLMSGVRR